MREYRAYKHQMGVAGPSFWREQQERRQREQEAREKQGRDQPKTQESAPKQQSSFFDFIPHKGEAPTPAAPPQQPAFQRRERGYVDPNRWFEVEQMWDYVGAVCKDPGYRGDTFQVSYFTLPTHDLSQTAQQVAKYFQIPDSRFNGLTLDEAWKRVIGPLLQSLEETMNQMKPLGIPGSLRFDIDQHGQLELVHQNR